MLYGWVVVWLGCYMVRYYVSYTPGLGLCRDGFKGGTRGVEHRNGTVHGLYYITSSRRGKRTKDEEVQ